MLEQRLAKMEKILLSPEAESSTKQKKNSVGSNEHEEDVDEDYEDDIDIPPLSASTTTSSNPFSSKSFNNNHGHTTATTSNNNKYSKRLSEDVNHDCASPTSYSSISSNFPSPPAHVLTHTPSRSDSDILPPMDVILHIVDLFFSNLFTTAPIFDEKTLRNDIKERRCSDFLLLSLLGACAR